MAAEKDDLGAVCHLLEKEPNDLDRCGREGGHRPWALQYNTPLIAAAREGHHQVVRELLLRGAKLDVESRPTGVSSMIGSRGKWQTGGRETAETAVVNKLSQQQAQTALLDRGSARRWLTQHKRLQLCQGLLFAARSDKSYGTEREGGHAVGEFKQKSDAGALGPEPLFEKLSAAVL